MGLRFNWRPRLGPFRLNFSKTGVSASIGTRGAWYTIGRRGQRATVGLPGSGLSYTATTPWRKAASNPGEAAARHAAYVTILVVAAGMLLAVVLLR